MSCRLPSRNFALFQAFSSLFLSPNHRIALQPSGASPCSAAPSSRDAWNIMDLPIPAAAKSRTATADIRLSCGTTLKAQSLGAAAGLLALSLLFANPVRALADSMPGTAPGCSSTTNVSGYTMVTCDRQGLDRDGRLLGCRCCKCVVGCNFRRGATPCCSSFMTRRDALHCRRLEPTWGVVNDTGWAT